MKDLEIKNLLDQLTEQFNHSDFIENDPISIPHQFSKKQDVEIAGFFAAIFAWGQRITIINKSNLLLSMMDNAPYDFLMNHEDSDLKCMESFVHRTFNATDLLYFIDRLKQFYLESDSLENAFVKHLTNSNKTIEKALVGFHQDFFDLDYAPKRSQKHVSTPARKSTCKRLCMFLRWMVRKDEKGVDFGIWHQFKPAQLMIPFDVHVERIARKFQLLLRKQRDWQAVKELTNNLRKFDKKDPVKYDFALFGASVNGLI